MSKKLLIRLSLVLASLILILLIFTPLIVRKVVVNNSKEWIGRSISLEKLKVNYFTGTVKLIDFNLYEEDDSTLFLGFDTLIIDTEPYRYISNEIVIEQLYLKGLKAYVVMYDSTFNFDDLLDMQMSEVSEEDTVSTAEPIKFELSNFELSEAYFTLQDAEIDKQMELNNIDFFVPYLSWDQEHTSEAGLKFDFKNGGFFQSNIDLDPKAGDFEAEIILDRLDITGYTDFVNKYVDVGTFSGRTDIVVNLTGNINHPDKLFLNGLLNLEDFELRDHADQRLFDVDKFRMALKEVDLENSRYIIDTVFMRHPSVYFEMQDSTNNITDYIDQVYSSLTEVSGADNKMETIDTTGATEMYYALNKFIIEDGILDILDRRTAEPFEYHLSQIETTADSINSKSVWIESQSNMLLNERGKLVAQVGVNPTAPMDQLMVDYTITDFMLSDLNIYSNHYMGFPILYGDMYYKAHTEINAGQLSSENKLIIHNVELGDKQGGLYDLPLKFALFLLKDKDGVINLDVPVSGDLKDPKVSVGKIVWNTFKNLIVKAAAAPVKLLSGLIGADPSDIEAIEYDYLDTTFTEKRQHQLDLLLELEQQKPALEIELIYLNDLELEKQQIAVDEVGRLFEKKNPNKNYQTHNNEFEDFVRTRVENDSIGITEACLQIADQVVVDSIAVEFGNKRTADISNYLNSTNDSTQILVIPYKRGAPKNPGSKPRFEVKYGMKEEHLP